MVVRRSGRRPLFPSLGKRLRLFRFCHGGAAAGRVQSNLSGRICTAILNSPFSIQKHAPGYVRYTRYDFFRGSKLLSMRVLAVFHNAGGLF